MIRFFIPLLLVLLPVAAPAVAPDADRVAEAVDRAVRPLLKQHDVAGIAVAVTVNGQARFFTYGLAAKDSRVPVTKDTLFELGSISKVFAATAVTYAQAQGRLSLDDHPGRYMPALRGSAIDAATVLHLGTYTPGGLPLQFPDGVRSDAQMIAYFRQWRPAAAPGAARQYSNPSLGLFGHLAGLAMGDSFADLVEGRLLPGLGLHHSHIRVPAAAMASYAWGYNRANQPVRVGPGVFDAEAYGLKSSAADMIRFVELNIRPDGLEPMLRRAVEGTQVGYFRIGDMVQGLGWEQYAWPTTLERLQAGNSETMSRQLNPATALTPPQRPAGPTLFNKTGSTNGFGAYVAFVPAQKTGVVLLANRGIPIPARVAAGHAVLEALAP